MSQLVAAATFSITCSMPFSLVLTVSVRQLDIASKAAFNALRASVESPGTELGLNFWVRSSVGITASPSH